MTNREAQEHAAKELLKLYIDSTPSYTKKVKADLKTIVDSSRSPEEFAFIVSVYFATFGRY